MYSVVFFFVSLQSYYTAYTDLISRFEMLLQPVFHPGTGVGTHSPVAVVLFITTTKHPPFLFSLSFYQVSFTRWPAGRVQSVLRHHIYTCTLNEQINEAQPPRAGEDWRGTNLIYTCCWKPWDERARQGHQEICRNQSIATTCTAPDLPSFTHGV